VPSLFRRRATDVVEETAAEAAQDLVEEEPDESQLPRGYTPSKKELGRATPKRPNAHVRRPGTTPAPRARKDMTKEERREEREERRARRREITEGMRRGDDRYLSGRDKGPEKALARDVVDSRRTVGTWFFAGALIVLLGSSAAMPAQVRLFANLLWALLAVAVILDAWLLSRKTRRLVRERFPDSDVRMRSLYFYVVMRSITFRKLRIPHPRIKFGDPV
jgi:hypothetical protein